MSIVKRAAGRVLFSKRVFEWLQARGIHLLHKNWYSPIPDTAQLAKNNGLWHYQSAMVGLDVNEQEQRRMVDEIIPRYKEECKFPLAPTDCPHEYYVNNNLFGLVSAAVYHCMIRHYKPRTVIEVGAGNSTYVAARAMRMNDLADDRLIAIEPNPNEVLRTGFPGLSELVQRPVQDVPLSFFERLQDNDLLFIDSSHVVRLGGDVIYLYLEVLPRLVPGVLVHVHDVYLPGNHPKRWVVDFRHFWTEQYLLQAFLAFNTAFEVLWSGTYAATRWPDDLERLLPNPLGQQINYQSSSFWMRRCS